MNFSCAIFNPPYQETRGETKNVDVWPAFIDEATKIAEVACVIHPGRWLIPKKQMQSVHNKIINSGLKSFDYYPDASDIFHGVAIDGGITITVFDGKYSGDIEYYCNGKFMGPYNDDIFFSNAYEEEAYTKIHDAIKTNKTMKDRILGNIGSLGGREFGYSKHTQLSQLSDNPATMKHPIKVWANTSFGKGGKFSWHFIEKDDLIEVPAELFATRKVMIDKKGHAITHGSNNVINNIPQVVECEATASGDVLFILPENDTEYDLKLIKSLFMTKTARFLMSITQKSLCVMGFENIPDYTMFIPTLNGDLFTDSFFYKTFGFSKELIEHIETHVSAKKDPNAGGICNGN